MPKTDYPAGRLEHIDFVVIFTRYQGRWVYCWHRRRESFEHPGGHVEPHETAMEAARRELFEETGISDASLLPLWDYEYVWEDGRGSNTGRVYYADVHSLGELPESEMDYIKLFAEVPENYTYDRDEEKRDLETVERMLRAFEGFS